MTDVFDRDAPDWTFQAEASTILQTTDIASLVTELGAVYTSGALVKPKHSATYWAQATASLDFTEADKLPTGTFNRLLWRGLKGDKPYPVFKNRDRPRVSMVAPLVDND